MFLLPRFWTKIRKIYETALIHRNDIKLLITNIEIAEKEVLLAKGSLQPNLAAFMDLILEFHMQIGLLGMEFSMMYLLDFYLRQMRLF